jgi:DNA-binding MarR family transcriptional regulator
MMGAELVNFNDTLIGLPTSSAEAFIQPECDGQLRASATEASPPIGIAFAKGLLDVAEEIYRVRRKRDMHFEELFGVGLFCEPAWDILLDLYINNGRLRTISISSACLASAVPATTALRHILELEKRMLVARYRHPDDRRVFVLHLTQLAVVAMEVLLNQRLIAQKGG